MGFESITGPNFIAPTAPVGDSSNRIADTAFVTAAVAAVTPPLNAVFLKGYLFGLTLSTAGSSSSFGIAAGTATDNTAMSYMALASAYTKTTGAWAVGSGNGALDTGSITATTWYHVFVIQRTDTNVVDVLISKSATSPTMPANYTLFRRIGAMKTDASSHWFFFYQNDDTFLWGNLPVGTFDYVANDPGVGVVTITLVSVPPGIRTFALAHLDAATLDAPVTLAVGWRIWSPDTPNYYSGGGLGILTQDPGVAQALGAGQGFWTNTVPQVLSQLTASDANVTVFMEIYGWIDPRGRLS